jgi:hypothetical protein
MVRDHGDRMIESFVNDYKRSDRDVDALTYVVLAFLLAFAGRAAMLIYQCRYHEIWPLLPQVVPLLSVLVVVRVANRLISNGKINREDDRRQELVRTTHHLIAITQDLQGRVNYVKAIFNEGGIPSIALFSIAKSIEERYEVLLQRDGYKFLPGPCVDIITRISGDIFGIRVLAEGMEQATTDKPALPLMPVLVKNDAALLTRLEELMNDLQELINRLFELRQSIEAAKEKQ